MARGTCCPVKAGQKNRTHLQVKRGQPLNPNSQVTSVLYQLKIHSGCRFCGVPAARARGEEDVLTWGHVQMQMHVQIFYTCYSFVAPTGQTMSTADSKFAGHMYATPAYMVFWLPFLGVQAARARTGKVYLRGVLRF